MIKRKVSLQRKATAMTVIVALQALAALFFAVDLAGDIAADGLGSHLLVEGLAVVALFVAVITGAFQVRSLVLASRQDELGVALARGAVSQLIQLRFAQWKLTSAEADVALFALKGFDVQEIADLRGSAPGTVRAQLTRVYAKSGTSSQSSLIAGFLEELVDPVPPSSPQDKDITA